MHRRSPFLGLLALSALALAATSARAVETKAFVFTSDFSTGMISVVNLNTRAVTPDVASVGSDAALRWYNGLLYVVNRFGGDNIQVVDPAQNYATVRQISTGNGSNPQDIAFFSPKKAYVSRYGSADLLVMNPSTPNGQPMSTISLAAFADADGLPEMAHMIRVGRYLFIACQRLTNFAASNPSVVVVIDMPADTVVDVDPGVPGKQAIALTGRNPVTTFAFDRTNSRLLLGEVGDYFALDGGIEAIDPVTFHSLGMVTTEAILGGDLADVEWVSPTHSYAVVSGSSTQLVSWNPTTGARIATVLDASGGFGVPDVELDDRGELYACRNTSTPSEPPGMMVYGTPGDALLAGPLGTGLPPIAVTFDQATDSVTAVPEVAIASASDLRLGPGSPNPTASIARFTLEGARAAQARVEIFDFAGRRVRELPTQLSGAREEITWDLADEAGRPVHDGIYFVRAKVDRRISVRRVVVLR